MVKIAVLDAFSGLAGDMWVGALLDLGLPLATLEEAVAGLGLPGLRLSSERVMRAGLAGTHFLVQSDEVDPPHRHLPEILQRISAAGLPQPVQDSATAVFETLAAAEAQVHGVSVDAVHFHEVGAADAIADIVCAAAGMHALGIAEVYCSAVTTGRGTVRCAHGEMPVPAPGALGSLLGVPLRSGGPDSELVTPTGAALAKTLVDVFEPQDLRFVPTAIGYGAGSKDFRDHPNLLRITLAERQDPGAAQSVMELSCQLDQTTGEEMSYLLDRAMQLGALDVFAAPILMKKGRSGQLLTVIADRSKGDELAQMLLQESGTLGVRRQVVGRSVLERWQETVDTELGAVLCKCARLPSGLVQRRPEEDEIRRLLRETGIDRATLLRRLVRQLGDD